MKSTMRIVVAAGLMMLAFSVVAAAGASAALPEFKPVPTKKKFKTAGGEFLWEHHTSSTNYKTVSCSKSTSTGEITGASTVGKLVTKFTGCAMIVAEAGEAKGPCQIHSPGANQGEIVTNVLKGELGTVKTTEAASGVGMLLTPETGGVLWETAETGAPCNTIETDVEGKIAGEVTPLNTKQLTSKLTFATKGSAGSETQDIKEITVKSGVVKTRLKWLSLEGWTVQQTDTTTFEEALEVT